MKEETKSALQRTLLWSALSGTALSAVGCYGIANNLSIQFFWLLGAPYALLSILPFLAAAFFPSSFGNAFGHFSGAALGHPMTSVILASIVIAFTWGVGFLWPHLAYCSTRDRKFLVWLWSFVGWSVFSVVATMGFMFWAFSEMGD